MIRKNDDEDLFKPLTDNPFSVTNDGFMYLYFYYDKDQQLKLRSRRMAAFN